MNQPIGEWLLTHSGIQYQLQNPHPGQVRISDIAHSLSHVCRWGGHTKHLYSVAQHSVLISHLFRDKDIALQALLHDATEAYLGDIPRPLKRLLGKVYSDLEEAHNRAIMDKFSLPHELHPSIKEVDNQITVDERGVLFACPVSEMDHEFKRGVPNAAFDMSHWRPEQAKHLFVQRYLDLTMPSGGRP